MALASTVRGSAFANKPISKRRALMRDTVALIAFSVFFADSRCAFSCWVAFDLFAKSSTMRLKSCSSPRRSDTFNPLAADTFNVPPERLPEIATVPPLSQFPSSFPIKESPLAAPDTGLSNRCLTPFASNDAVLRRPTIFPSPAGRIWRTTTKSRPPLTNVPESSAAAACSDSISSNTLSSQLLFTQFENRPAIATPPGNACNWLVDHNVKIDSKIPSLEDTMNLIEAEIVELRQQANGRSVRADLARRAGLILLLAEGLTWRAIRAKLDCNDSYIALWSKRFAADRLAGLFSRHAGRQRYKVTDRLEARVLARTTKHKPADGSTHWSTRKLAAELGGDISHMTVARIWAKHGLKPHRLEGYLASNDPDFETKAADVIGLYLNPPQHA